MARKYFLLITVSILVAFLSQIKSQENTNITESAQDVNDANNDNQRAEQRINDIFNINTNDEQIKDITPSTLATDKDKVEEPGKSCGENRECVPIFLCKNDTISKFGVGLINIRARNVCDYLQVCCNVEEKTKELIIDPVPPTQHIGCGYRNPFGVGYRITGGEENESEFAEFPWMVAILSDQQVLSITLEVYVCGGALIAPNVVLTATHCVRRRKAETLFVRAGEWDTQNVNEILPHEDRRVAEVITHERFSSGSLIHDVALVILEKPFTWQEHIRPICLPDTNTIFDHARCFATGWGQSSYGNNSNYQVILKKIDLPVVPHDACQEQLRLTRFSKQYQLHESFICAGGEKDKGTCKGDGGSPLVCPVPGYEDRFYQAGIVAWGIECGKENVPDIFANVPYLRKWIDEKLKERNIDFSNFTP